MTTIDPHRAQILRQQLGRVLRGKQIQDGVGALEMAVVDVLIALPGASEVLAVVFGREARP